jgi:uncharacterized protein (UPF0332 family)
MALHDDLLEQAAHLASRERKKPRQASLRRAVSAAYYALFHLLAAEGARNFVPSQPPGLRAQVGRAFSHDGMEQVCKQFAAGAASERAAQLLQGPIEPDLKAVAQAFVFLQRARHEADYDVGTTFNRVDTLQNIERARAAFRSWQQVRSNPNSLIFLAALLLQKNWRG